MSWLYRRLIRPLLFSQDSEVIHDRTLALLATLGRRNWTLQITGALFPKPSLPVEVFGLNFPNPVGLAAGMDKNAAALPVWQALGFGFVELGGVTWHAQAGNPKPRMFRAVEDEALINRMGFNNIGAEAMAVRLNQWKEKKLWPSHPVAINLGKSKITPLKQAAGDYANSFRVLKLFADFFVINVSSPNTPNLRQLQDKSALDDILAAVQEENSRVDQTAGKRRPILVKVSPDLSFEALDEILELVPKRNIAGLVATNTTLTRPETRHEVLNKIYEEAGGLSGKPLARRSTEVIAHIRKQTRGALPVIGVGGILNAEDAREKKDAGAALIQIYTGLVYEGPGLIRTLVRALGKG